MHPKPSSSRRPHTPQATQRIDAYPRSLPSTDAAAGRWPLRPAHAPTTASPPLVNPVRSQAVPKHTDPAHPTPAPSHPRAPARDPRYRSSAAPVRRLLSPMYSPSYCIPAFVHPRLSSLYPFLFCMRRQGHNRIPPLLPTPFFVPAHAHALALNPRISITRASFPFRGSRA